MAQFPESLLTQLQMQLMLLSEPRLSGASTVQDDERLIDVAAMNGGHATSTKGSSWLEIDVYKH